MIVAKVHHIHHNPLLPPPPPPPGTERRSSHHHLNPRSLWFLRSTLLPIPDTDRRSSNLLFNPRRLRFLRYITLSSAQVLFLFLAHRLSNRSHCTRYDCNLEYFHQSCLSLRQEGSPRYCCSPTWFYYPPYSYFPPAVCHCSQLWGLSRAQPSPQSDGQRSFVWPCGALCYHLSDLALLFTYSSSSRPLWQCYDQISPAKRCYWPLIDRLRREVLRPASSNYFPGLRRVSELVPCPPTSKSSSCSCTLC